MASSTPPANQRNGIVPASPQSSNVTPGTSTSTLPSPAPEDNATSSDSLVTGSSLSPISSPSSYHSSGSSNGAHPHDTSLDTSGVNQTANQVCTPEDGQALNRSSSSASQPIVPTWNAATLLDPRHHARLSNQPPPQKAPASAAGRESYLPDIRRPDVHYQYSTDGMPPATRNGNSGGLGPSGITFQFMGSATDKSHPTTADQAFAEQVNGASLAGGEARTKVEPADGPVAVSSMIERGFHLQDRQDVPEPKRRKIISDGLAASKQTFKHGSGILAEGVKSEAAKADSKNDTAALTSANRTPVTVDLTDGVESDSAIKERYEEVCFGSLMGVTVDCHKLPVPKPGSQAIGGPAYWPAVKIVFRRIVGDKTNTVQVYDHTRQVFGSLDKKTADCLAPLMDIPNLHLRTDAKIPTRRKNEDEIIGRPISRAYKIELVLYGAASFGRAVGNRLGKFGLKLVQPHRYDTGVRLALPVQPTSALEAAKAGSMRTVPTPSSLYSTSVSSTPAMSTRTMEEIRSEVMTVFDSMANAEDLPEMEPGRAVVTPMLRHQKQALYFMTNREKPQAETKLTSSIWQKKVTPGNRTIFYNVITGQTETQPPSETLGGILADMMGLGKTLSVLALVASTRGDAEKWRDLAPVQPKAPEKKKKPGAPHNFDAPVPAALELTKLKRNGRGTLLVCPLSTITNWEEQIKQHLFPDSLSYHIYHGQNRVKDVELLSEFDLVITTYGSVSSELTARNKGKVGDYPLEEVGWFRVVLDEAHMIREPSTLQFKAICRLQASRRWAVTGTPVQNRLDDLGSLLAFLRLKPFDDRAKFTYHIVNPFRACDPNILPQLRILVDTITLRRLKDKIDLPPRTDTIVKLDFSDEESRLYGFFARNAKDRLQVLTGQNERLLGGKTYIHILQAILRLRLICAHGRDLLSNDDLKLMQGSTIESAIDLDDDEDASGEAKGPLSEAKAYEIFDLLINTNADTCVHCKRKLGSADDMSTDIRSEKQEDIVGYITPCFHAYCPDCVKQFRDEERGFSHKSKLPGICPICSEHVVFACTELRHDRADTEHDAPPHHHNGHGSDGPAVGNGRRGGARAAASSHTGKSINEDEYTGPHTKTKALIEDLLKHKAESEARPDEPPIKSVVFSGWTSHLDLIQLALERANIAYCRLDGKMTRLARSQAMDTLREDPNVHVILVSIMAGGLGLNLTAANHVYVMEPQYNPAAEAQAIDRVHRLGQKRPVHTVRYIMRNSFEERMQDIQNMKIKLANLSMDRADRTVSVADAARQRLQDLRSLFK